MIPRPTFTPNNRYSQTDLAPLCERLEHVMTLLEALIAVVSAPVIMNSPPPIAGPKPKK